MGQRFLSCGQFAKKAGVSIRALRYYDRVGLLPPSRHTEAGYRLYTDEDLAALQQILALKFLGFSLAEIRACLAAGSRQLRGALAQQKAMMREKQAHCGAVIQAIERTERLLRSDEWTWDSLVQVIEVIQVEQKNDWVNKYFTPEQRAKMDELGAASYSEEARQALASRGPWTEEDQQRADAQWAWVNDELKRLIAAGADPASPEAQTWAKTRHDLLAAFTGGDSQIESGLNQFWQNFWALPEGERPMAMTPPTEAETAFTGQAMEVFNQRRQATGEA